MFTVKGVARLATAWLQQQYPEVEVHTLHSGVEIFHYDANVQFVNNFTIGQDNTRTITFNRPDDFTFGGTITTNFAGRYSSSSVVVSPIATSDFPVTGQTR